VEQTWNTLGFADALPQAFQAARFIVRLLQTESYRPDRKMLHIATSCAFFATNAGIRRDLKMTTAVRVSEELVREGKIYSKIDKRSVTGQIEHWARIGKCSEENPDLTYSLIKACILIFMFARYVVQPSMKSLIRLVISVIDPCHITKK
jgi:hypothetical protein